MQQHISAFLVGLLFGLGLFISGMTDPNKVQNFLDLAGRWDPSLALVMGGAIGVSVFAFLLAKKRELTYLGEPMNLPKIGAIDRRLVIGALLFGAGWGLAGFCPGPALVSMFSGQEKAFVFVAAMVVGMLGFDLVYNHFNQRKD